MTDGENTWLVFVTSSMALLVVGLLLLEGAAWYVRYPVFAVALSLAVFGVRAELRSPSA